MIRHKSSVKHTQTEIEPGYWPLLGVSDSGEMKVYTPTDVSIDEIRLILANGIRALEFIAAKPDSHFKHLDN